ncbi:MAG: hypothetical protein IJ566_00795 [Cardiobacteriaceae bacterium]|nr:hypothetical protein [Cardiobacteriaceae bacterium]
MSIYDKQQIDIVGIKDNRVVLVITDPLEWTDNKQQDEEHLLLLQEKLNSHLGSYENGELAEKYPQAKDKPLQITIVGKYCLNKKGIWFINQVRKALKNTDLDITIHFEWADIKD